MRYAKAAAVLVGAFMLVLPLTSLVSAGGAGHEEGAPMMVTLPSGGVPISCAVYFADNMVFAPQWRVDNLVRIEMMIIDMTGSGNPEDGPLVGPWDDPTQIENDTINLDQEQCLIDYPPDDPDYEDYWIKVVDPLTQEVTYVWNQQAFLLAESSNIAETRMVSVSYIRVTIIGEGDAAGYSKSFEAGWLCESPYDRVIFSELGREVNKHGNLIYGMQWDTADPEEPAPAGEYRVDIQLGKVSYNEDTKDYEIALGADYSVDFAVGHLYVGDGVLFSDDHPYISLVSSEGAYDPDSNPDGDDVTIVYGDVELWVYDDLGVGLGGISTGAAWVLLGPLIDRGPGGGNGGDGGDSEGGDGGGNGIENGGNGWGNVGNRALR